MEYSSIAKAIIDHVGKKANINSLMHCATRLRFSLKDKELVNEAELEKMEIVKGTFYSNGQYQIIIGAGTVNMVCDEMQKILGIHSETPDETQEPKEKGNFVQRGIKLLSDIFVPIIPAIVAGGLLMGINNILSAPFFNDQSIIQLYPQFTGLATMINTFANAPFVFLPVLLGFSAVKKFGGNPYLGAAMGMIMVHPDLLNAYSLGGNGVEIPYWNMFGFEVAAVGYQGTVLPVLAVSWILATIEKSLRKITPSWLDNLSTPLLAILITAFLTFTIVGPITRGAGDVMAQGITWIYTSLGFLGGAIFGGLYAPIVITGMHHSFIAIETQLLADVANTGGSFIFVTASMSNVAQGAAVLAVLCITKNEKMKSLCSASGISALLGITEPAMFGVNLKLRYPFIAACIGSACGSAWIALHHILAQSLGAAGLPGFISVDPSNWFNFAIGLVIAISVSFFLTYLFAKRKESKEETIVSLEQTQDSQTNISDITSPMCGEIKPIEEASDAMFAAKTMGDGVVILPSNGEVYAPFDASVEFVFPSKHAIGLSASDGTQLLLHCGMDTVELQGEGFEVFVNEKDFVKQGTLMMRCDLALLKEKGYNMETPCILTKLPEGKQIAAKLTGECTQNSVIMQLR